MLPILRRYVAVTAVLGVAVAGVQALLVLLVASVYRDSLNRRVGEISLATQAALVADEREMGHSWSAIEERLRTRLQPAGAADDDELAIYDRAGRLLLRSGGQIPEVPERLAPEVLARLTSDVMPLEIEHRLGVVAVGAARDIAGERVYLIRANSTFRNAVPNLVQLGFGALVLPIALLGLAGGFAILRTAGRQLAKVDKVLRQMAGGDLSARMSLPVDRDTAAVVLSFNRMAEKVEQTIEKLRRSDESRRQLLADVTHELNTPLTSVLGYLETLCMEDLPLSDEKRHALTRVAYEEAHNLRTLIEDLTTLSRLDAEGLPLERAPLQLGPVAERVVRRLTPVAEARRLQLLTEIEPGVTVNGDAQRLDQVVRNLVENALRHTDPPNEVTVVVRTAWDRAVLEVKDRGKGIPAEDLPRLGQRFLRLDRSRSRHTGGRGLGLAITVGLVEMHGGKVEFESAVGRGTTVRVTLPLLRQPVSTQPIIKAPDLAAADPMAADPTHPDVRLPEAVLLEESGLGPRDEPTLILERPVPPASPPPVPAPPARPRDALAKQRRRRRK
jgi:signal transduction histidine kinase